MGADRLGILPIRRQGGDRRGHRYALGPDTKSRPHAHDHSECGVAKIPIANFSLRDRVLIQTIIGLHQETKPAQVRHLLSQLRELLLHHPRIDGETVRVRLIGLEELAHGRVLLVRNNPRMGGVSQHPGRHPDILLRVMEIIGQAGATLAG